MDKGFERPLVSYHGGQSSRYTFDVPSSGLQRLIEGALKSPSLDLVLRSMHTFSSLNPTHMPSRFFLFFLHHSVVTGTQRKYPFQLGVRPGCEMYSLLIYFAFKCPGGYSSGKRALRRLSKKLTRCAVSL